MEIVFDFRRLHPGEAAPPLADPTFGLLSSFQTALGHELPNLLMPLQAYSRLLMEQHSGGLDEEGRGLVERIANLSLRADELARQLAEVGRLCRSIENGTDGPAGVNLAELAVEARAAVAFQNPGRTISHTTAGELPILPVSQAAAFPVLVALLTRAVRSAPASQALAIEVGGQTSSEGVSFWVRDDGPALAESQEASLFDPFPRDRPGLFLVQQVVARWGGLLTVRSATDQGTRVTIELSRQ